MLETRITFKLRTIKNEKVHAHERSIHAAHSGVAKAAQQKLVVHLIPNELRLSAIIKLVISLSRYFTRNTLRNCLRGPGNAGEFFPGARQKDINTCAIFINVENRNRERERKKERTERFREIKVRLKSRRGKLIFTNFAKIYPAG